MSPDPPLRNLNVDSRHEGQGQDLAGAAVAGAVAGARITVDAAGGLRIAGEVTAVGVEAIELAAGSLAEERALGSTHARKRARRAHAGASVLVVHAIGELEAVEVAYGLLTIKVAGHPLPAQGMAERRILAEHVATDVVADRRAATEIEVATPAGA